MIVSIKKKKYIKYNQFQKINIFLNRIEYITIDFLTIVFSLIVIGLIITYGEIILGYKMGEYKEVEGVVENYEKHPWRENFYSFSFLHGGRKTGGSA